MKRLVSVKWLLCWALALPWVAGAEPSRFTPATLDVVSADVLLAGAGPSSFQVGQELAFVQSPQYRDARPVSARLFALPEQGKVPASWASFEPCLVYLSTLVNLTANPSGLIKLFTLSPAWLSFPASGQPRRQRYLVVFERGSGDGWDFIRLHKDQAPGYFAQGIVIVVQPDRTYASADVSAMAQKDAERSAAAMALARRNDPTYRCYAVRLASQTGQDPVDRVLAMGDCEPADTALY